MEIILYALTSMLFSVITVIIIFLGIYLLTQGSQEEQRWKKEQEKLLQEELIQARKEDREEQEKRIEAGSAQEASFDS